MAGLRFALLWFGATVVAVAVAVQAVGFASTQVVDRAPPTVSLAQTPSDSSPPTSSEDASALSPDENSTTLTADGVSASIRSVSSVGGTATFRVSGDVVDLLSAQPNSGFAVEVNDVGAQLEVRFVSSAHVSSVRARPDGAAGRIVVAEQSGGSDVAPSDGSSPTNR